MPDFIPHKTTLTTRPDGSFLYTSQHPLGPVSDTTADWLHHWASATPDQVFLAERASAGWREIPYGEALQSVRALAAGLLAAGLHSGDRLAILSGNSIDHGLLMLAAQYVGVIPVPIAEQYSLIPEAHDRLHYIISKIKPALVYVSDTDQYAAALNLAGLQGIPVLASHDSGRANHVFADLMRSKAGPELAAAHAKIAPGTVAKILFTSGSASQPKGVVTSQRMLCVNQAQVAVSMPFLRTKPPKILDWLPWNHVFGGSHNFNMMLANGGALYIDEGKPVAGLFDKTLANMREHSGNLAFNVPVGWALLSTALKADKALRHIFFDGLDLMFYAGASLPETIWNDLKTMAMDTLGHLPLMVSSWGMTETSPAALGVHEPVERSGMIGVPLPDVEVKLIPDDDMRCELRVRGPNILTVYYRDAEKTAAAFDDEGFLITEDAVRFADADDPDRGLIFDGRLSEDFKLMSGTWVQTACLRAIALATLGPLAADVVVTGHGRAEIGLLIFPTAESLGSEAPGWQNDNGALIGGDHCARVRACLQDMATRATGSSSKITRALILADPPSLKDHEVTAKGNLNINKVLTGRAGLVERLYDDGDGAVILL
ncbi:MAG: feruloyl-CoA synthase [Alphaproteobacteria bacterium]|nr:feruloyl-CoA synthase [Alphaproteobacteria bacterium]